MTGEGSRTCTCEVFDPRNDCWAKFAPLKVPRAGHTMNSVGQNILVTGGTSDALRAALACAEIYESQLCDTDTAGTWILLPRAMGTGRTLHGVAVAHPLRNRPATDVIGDLGRHGSLMTSVRDGKHMAMDWQYSGQWVPGHCPHFRQRLVCTFLNFGKQACRSAVTPQLLLP